jgi:protein-tyrosine phosphatase
MIDWHCHILPGLDDGPETMVESLAMARLLADAGFRVIHCTPHCIHGRYDTSSEEVRRLTERIQRYLLTGGIPLLVKPGMEYFLDEHFPKKLDDLQTLGDSRLLLVEIPVKAGLDLVLENVNLILQRGFTPLVAHPERCPLLSRPVRRKGELKYRMKQMFRKRSHAMPGKSSLYYDLRQGLLDMGCLFQGDIGSFSGRYGAEARREAWQYLESGLYSRLGSDGHGYRSLQVLLCPGLSLVEEYPSGDDLLKSPMPAGIVLKLKNQDNRKDQSGCQPT